MGGQAWCYVQGDDLSCDASNHSMNPDENKTWRPCMTCQCMARWMYQGEMHRGCYDDHEWGAKWCYVDGGEHCHDALPSEVAGEHRHYRKCGDDNKCMGAKAAYKASQCCGNPHKMYH